MCIALKASGASAIRQPKSIDRKKGRSDSHDSHIPPILPTHIVQRMADLAQRVGLHSFHHRFEHVAAFAGGVLKVAQAVAVVGITPRSVRTRTPECRYAGWRVPWSWHRRGLGRPVPARCLVQVARFRDAIGAEFDVASVSWKYLTFMASPVSRTTAEAVLPFEIAVLRHVVQDG